MTYRILFGRISFVLSCCVLGATVSCGDDDDGVYRGTEADWLGVGAACTSDDMCYQGEDGGLVQKCLTQFKGGYCGIADCQSDADCPDASACVAHDDGNNYCFRICMDKIECNRNRPADAESNCSANVTFVDGGKSERACVPPSG